MTQDKDEAAFLDAALKLFQAQLDDISLTCNICGSETTFDTNGFVIMKNHLDTHTDKEQTR